MNQSHSSTLNDELDGDTLHEECGVFGVLGHPDGATLTALGLHALQHRGQEAAGIVTFDGKQFHTEKRMGLVGDHYTDPVTLAKLPGLHLDRPYALFDDGRSGAAQRPAAVCRTRSRRHCRRP
jgi:amidophosphoribosyltransferase